MPDWVSVFRTGATSRYKSEYPSEEFLQNNSTGEFVAEISTRWVCCWSSETTSVYSLVCLRNFLAVRKYNLSGDRTAQSALALVPFKYLGGIVRTGFLPRAGTWQPAAEGYKSGSSLRKPGRGNWIDIKPIHSATCNNR